MKELGVEGYNWTIAGGCNCPVCSGRLGVNITAYHYRTGRKAKRLKECLCEVSGWTDEQKQLVIEALQKEIKEAIEMIWDTQA